MLLVLVFSISIRAQDVHYSQFYALPTTLNPALTGFFQGPYRLAGIYRSQWAGFAPFLTQSVSGEWKVRPRPDEKDPNKSDVVGIAALLTNDKAGIDAGISTMKAYFSMAVNIDLGFMHLGIGAQPGYVQRNLFGVNRFPDQWDEIRNVFDPMVATQEQYSNNVGYFDLNGGLLGTKVFGEEVRHSAYVGYSAFHILRPREEFVAATINNITPVRHVLHFGGRIRTGVSRPISIVPSGIFMWIPASAAKERNFGVDVEYDFKQVNSSFSGKWILGGYKRIYDSWIIHTAMEVNDFLVGFSYDINSSELKEASGMKGGFEISVRYTPLPVRQIKRLDSNPCPHI